MINKVQSKDVYIVRRGRRDDEGCVEGVKEMVGEIGDRKSVV